MAVSPSFDEAAAALFGEARAALAGRPDALERKAAPLRAFAAAACAARCSAAQHTAAAQQATAAAAQLLARHEAAEARLRAALLATAAEDAAMGAAAALEARSAAARAAAVLLEAGAEVSRSDAAASAAAACAAASAGAMRAELLSLMAWEAFLLRVATDAPQRLQLLPCSAARTAVEALAGDVTAVYSLRHSPDAPAELQASRELLASAPGAPLRGLPRWSEQRSPLVKRRCGRWEALPLSRLPAEAALDALYDGLPAGLPDRMNEAGQGAGLDPELRMGSGVRTGRRMLSEATPREPAFPASMPLSSQPLAWLRPPLCAAQLAPRARSPRSTLFADPNEPQPKHSP